MMIPEPPKRDEVFVSWEQSWPVERYVDWYLETRRHPRTAIWSDAVISLIQAMPEQGMLRKSDLDYFLDENAGRWQPALSHQQPDRSQAAV